MTMLIKWDNQVAMSRPSPKRPATPYLRGLIIQAEGELAVLKGERVLAWGDTDPIEEYGGKFTHTLADLRDKVRVEVDGQDTNQETIVLANVKITKVVPEAEAEKLQGQAMVAQLQHLGNRGSRKIQRTADPMGTERRLSGELGSTPADVAGQLAAEAVDANKDGEGKQEGAADGQAAKVQF